MRLMPQRIDCSLWSVSTSGGPNIIRRGHHHIDRILRHGALRSVALAHHRQRAVEALALMKTLFAADARHGARMAVRATAQRHLVHHRRASTSQPMVPTSAQVERGIAEYGAVFRLALMQRRVHLVAALAEGLGAA